MRIVPALTGLAIAACAGRSAQAAESNLASQLKAEIIRCWNLPSGYDPGPSRIMLHVRLAPDGAVLDVETVMLEPNTSKVQFIAASAVGAIRRCGPFKDLPSGQYSDWKSVWINFRPMAE